MLKGQIIIIVKQTKKLEKISEILDTLISDIPDDYVICDGKNGTPDLSDKFITDCGSELDGRATATPVLLIGDKIHKRNEPEFFALVYAMKNN